MSEVQNEPPVTGHNYDGIQEYDNPLPGWWKWLFVGSFAYSLVYLLYFHTGAPNRSIYEAFDVAVAVSQQKLFAQIGNLEPDQATLLKYESDADWLKYGQSVYRSNCASCHGANGGGLVGPNLTDESWKHIKGITDIAKIVQVGAAGGAMPAWSNRLSQNDIVMVSAFVASLRGTDPGAGAKAAEGNSIPPWDYIPEGETPTAPPETSETASTGASAA